MSASKVIEPELSYRIVGIAYKVFKELGFGYQEKYYQRAYELELAKERIGFSKEKLAVLEYSGKNIGNYKLDFLIENRIIVEMKVGEQIHRRDFKFVIPCGLATGSPYVIPACAGMTDTGQG